MEITSQAILNREELDVWGKAGGKDWVAQEKREASSVTILGTLYNLLFKLFHKLFWQRSDNKLFHKLSLPKQFKELSKETFKDLLLPTACESPS